MRAALSRRAVEAREISVETSRQAPLGREGWQRREWRAERQIDVEADRDVAT